MKITLGEEQLVAAGPRPEDSSWGYFQFPRLFRHAGGIHRRLLSQRR